MASFTTTAAFIAILIASSVATSQKPAFAQDWGGTGSWNTGGTSNWSNDAASDGTSGAISDDGQAIGIAEATGNLPVRAAPPSGWLARPGQELYSTAPGQEYIVLETRDVPRFFELDHWVRVAPVDENGELSGEIGWAYWGTNDVSSAGNFEFIDRQGRLPGSFQGS